jgi:hypothetical protein
MLLQHHYESHDLKIQKQKVNNWMQVLLVEWQDFSQLMGVLTLDTGFESVLLESLWT